MFYVPLLLFLINTIIFVYLILSSGWNPNLIILSYILELTITAIITIFKINYIHDHINEIEKPNTTENINFKSKNYHLTKFAQTFSFVSVALYSFLWLIDIDTKIIFSREFLFIACLFLTSHVSSYLVNFIGKKEYVKSYKKEIVSEWFFQNAGLICAAVFFTSSDLTHISTGFAAFLILFFKIGIDLIRHLYKHNLYRR
jgi:hypothetical protein